MAERLGAFLSHHTKALKGTQKTDCKQGNHPLTSSLYYPPLYSWGKSVASFTLALWSLCPYLSSINNNTRKRKCNRHCFSDKWNFFCDFSPTLVLNLCTFLYHSVLSTDKWDNISNNESTTVWQIVLVLSDTVDSFYRPTKGGRLSQPKHCSKGAQPVLKTVYCSSCRNKQNCQQRDI